MRVVILSNPEEVSRFVADEIATLVRTKPNCVLGLATGGTPVQAYQLLIEKVKAGDLSFAQVRSFNLDEYVGLSETHPCSYRRFMNENLFDQIDIPLNNTYVPRVTRTTSRTNAGNMNP